MAMHVFLGEKHIFHVEEIREKWLAQVIAAAHPVLLSLFWSRRSRRKQDVSRFAKCEVCFTRSPCSEVRDRGGEAEKTGGRPRAATNTWTRRLLWAS